MNRILYISNECYLSIRDKNILVSSKKSGNTMIPIGDIDVVVLENNYSTLSSAFLSKLAENNIVLFTCDSSFMPNGVFLPFHQHSRYSDVSYFQIKWSEPFKKRVWQKIIKNKIKNQIELLDYFGFDTKDIKHYILKVNSGDSLNIESIVASIYWNTIWSNSLNYFTRSMNDIRNSALNYGYAIIRGAISRTLVAKGFSPFYGLHHKNKLNAFNLSDDIIEVFRCAIDREVFLIFEKEKNDSEILTKDIKKRLLSVFESEFIVDDNIYSFTSAVDLYIDSLKKATKLKDSKHLINISLKYF